MIGKITASDSFICRAFGEEDRAAINENDLRQTNKTTLTARMIRAGIVKNFLISDTWYFYTMYSHYALEKTKKSILYTE